MIVCVLNNALHLREQHAVPEPTPPPASWFLPRHFVCKYDAKTPELSRVSR